MGSRPYAVDGVITPDTYVVAKNDELELIETNISKKTIQLAFSPVGGTCEIPVEGKLQSAPCLSYEQIKTLADYALRIERHYEYPQDIEWALDASG